MRAKLTGHKIWLVSAFALTMTGCFSEKPFGETAIGGNTGGTPTNPPPPTTQPPPPSTINRVPKINGIPIATVRVGEPSAFRPNTYDADGDTLRFSIQNRPAWATFDAATGGLVGTPDAGDVGQFSDVRITVTDGHAQATLNPFAIEVTQVALGSVTLSWTPPTTNVDGSPMTDLAGYRIYYGRTATTLDQIIPVTNAGTTRFVVDNLSPATWFFSMTSVNSEGVESTLSTVVSTNLT
jgi:hypothetical protein